LNSSPSTKNICFTFQSGFSFLFDVTSPKCFYFAVLIFLKYVRNYIVSDRNHSNSIELDSQFHVLKGWLHLFTIWFHVYFHHCSKYHCSSQNIIASNIIAQNIIAPPKISLLKISLLKYHCSKYHCSQYHCSKYLC